jgi:hypothetical protein
VRPAADADIDAIEQRPLSGGRFHVPPALGRPPSCPLSEVFLPRRLIVGEAVDDPNRRFANVN